VSRVRPFLLLGLTLCGSGLAVAQQGVTGAPPPGNSVDSMMAMLAGSGRAKISRAELLASKAEIEQTLANSGYSGALRGARRAELEQIERRLADGDFYPGDVIMLQVSGDPRMTNNYIVSPRRSLLIPGVPGEVSVTGLLRSEVEAHLDSLISRYVRNPTVWAEPLLRIQIFGAVGRPGYHLVPVSLPLPDIIMNFAGGPSANADPKRGAVFRAEEQVLPGAALEEAIREARSLDALNLQSGDRIEYGARPTGGSFLSRTVGFIGGAASLLYVITRVI
jgi:hypothetical protein